MRFQGKENGNAFFLETLFELRDCRKKTPFLTYMYKDKRKSKGDKIHISVKKKMKKIVFHCGVYNHLYCMRVFTSKKKNNNNIVEFD